MTTIRTGEASFGADALLDCVPFISGQGVKYVNLKWTWNHEIVIDAPRRWPFTDGGNIRARYIGKQVDAEYSYVGVFEPEAFSEFAKGYSCWDGEGLAIVDGVLTGTVDAWDPDAKEFPDEDEEISVIEWEDLGLANYEYWDEDAKKWRMLP